MKGVDIRRSQHAPSPPVLGLCDVNQPRYTMKPTNITLQSSHRWALLGILAGLCFLTIPLARGQDALIDEAKAILTDKDRRDEIDEVRRTYPTLTLNELTYQNGDEISVKLRFTNRTDAERANDTIALVDPETNDVEIVQLRRLRDPLVWESDPISIVLNDAKGESLNDRLEVKPGSVFLVFYGHRPPNERTHVPIMDFGIVADKAASDGQHRVLPALAVNEEEGNPRRERSGPRMATIARQGVPGLLQIALDEVLFHPKDDNELKDFMAKSGARIIQRSPHGTNGWHRMAITPDASKVPFLAPMRDLTGETGQLLVSDSDVLALFTTTFAWWLEGYQVALHPRLNFFGLKEDYKKLERDNIDFIHNSDTSKDEISPSMWDENLLGLQKMWAFMDMFDFTRQAWSPTEIPVGFVDVGFAPNPDFRGYPNFVEYDFENNQSGPGAASKEPVVGNSFFGKKSWHGNGAVTTAGGVLGNNYGVAGTGGQVVVPMLYRMGLSNFAFDMGAAIKRAVDDGASIVNVSAGYPCRVLWALGPDNICTVEGRAAMVAKLTALAKAAALALCTIPDPIFCVIAQTTAAKATITAFATLFLGDTIEPVQAGVDYALARGVPVVASAGNRISSLPSELASIMNLPPKEDWSLDDWQTIPAFLPGVIAVGAADADTEMPKQYPNRHLWGDRVDIWAPIRYPYLAPEKTDIDPLTAQPQSHIVHSFGGTSAAAPYVTGVIANMMAANPDLDPKRAPTSSLPNIPNTIRNLLVSTSHKAANLPKDPNNPDYARRRNLIHPYGAVRAAAAPHMPDLEAAGFFSEDFGRFDDIESQALTLSLNGTTKVHDELISLDVDEFTANTPGGQQSLFLMQSVVYVPGAYAQNSQEGLRMDNEAHSFELSQNHSTGYGFSHGLYFGGSALTTSLRVSGAEADNPYRLEIPPPVTVFPPAPDDFESGSGNNSILTATPIGENTTNDWVGPITAPFSKDHRICVENLNFHQGADHDWYKVQFPSNLVPEGCGANNDPWIEFHVQPYNPGIKFAVYTKWGQLIDAEPGTKGIQVTCPDFVDKTPLYVKVEYLGGGDTVGYNLKIMHRVGNDIYTKIPDLLKQFLDPQETIGPNWTHVLQGTQFLSEDVFDLPGGIGWERGADGLVLGKKLFTINVREAGPLTILADLPPGSPLSMELWPADPAASRALASARQSEFLRGDSQLKLNLRHVEPGAYLLALGHFAEPFGFALWLSENASSETNRSLALERFPSERDRLAVKLAPVNREAIERVPSRFRRQLLDPQAPFEMFTTPAKVLTFEPSRFGTFRVERGVNGTWEPVGEPISTGPGRMARREVGLGDARELRVVNENGEEVPYSESPAVEITVRTFSDKLYTVQFTHDLASDHWNDMHTFKGTGTPHTEVLVPPADEGSSLGFFRVVEKPFDLTEARERLRDGVLIAAP